MIFRKPYAFLIKNFKKIHFLLLILWGYIYYRMYILKNFINDFTTFGIYNRNVEGIATKVNFSLYLAIIMVIIICVAMLILLVYKKKPWKIYIAPIVIYIITIYGLISVSNYFNSYTIISAVSDVFLSRDILKIARILQYPVLFIIIMRLTGMDIKKFGFNSDEEFLELSNKDREEFEVNIDIDKESFVRVYKRLKRNIGYVYQEHKFIINLSIVILVAFFLGYSYYFFGIKHKNYKQGEVYSVGIYDIKIKNVYITEKDTIGNTIEEENKFVIAVIDMTNKSEKKVTPNFKRFQLMNKTINRTNTIYYDDSFKDIGKGVSSDNSLNSKQTKEFVLIYKVPKDLKNDKFVLCYQEYNGKNDTYLRKIKLKYEDINKIKEKKNYNIGEELEFKLLNGESNIVTFESAVIKDRIKYNRYLCSGYGCGINEIEKTAQNGEKIIKIAFSSSDYEGKEFIDFTMRYGIIKYVDNENKEHTESIKSSVETDYEGKEIYINISKEVAESKEIYIDYKVRNNEYIVKVK